MYIDYFVIKIYNYLTQFLQIKLICEVQKMAKKPFDIVEICDNFSLKGEFTGYEKINNGHINSTYNLVFENNGKNP